MEYYRIAQILRPHGVRGEVKIYPLTEDPSRFKRLKACYLERSGQYEPIAVSGAKQVGGAYVLKIEGVDDPEQAQSLREKYICVDKEHAVRLPEDCWFVADLIGCLVSDTNGASYGELTDVLETNANDVYVIEGERRLLVPALKKLLVSVDTEGKSIVLDADVLTEVGLFED